MSAGFATFARNSFANKENGAQVAVDAPRYESGGVMIEEGTTNVFVNPETPVTQTITLAAGFWTCSVIGAGTVAISAGTAKGAGFDTASVGSPVSFTVSTAGTVVFTVAGADATSKVQVENKPYPTSFIAGTRDDESLSFPITDVSPSSFTAELDIDVDTAGHVYKRLGTWIDPTNSQTYQDAAATTPAATGDPVGYVQDMSGNGFHLTQATSLSKPTLQQDANGKYYLAFDGVDDVMTATFPSALGDCTLVFAGAEQVSVMYPLNVGTTFDLHTGPCYGLILINRELTAEELGGGGI